MGCNVNQLCHFFFLYSITRCIKHLNCSFFKLNLTKKHHFRNTKWCQHAQINVKVHAHITKINTANPYAQTPDKKHCCACRKIKNKKKTGGRLLTLLLHDVLLLWYTARAGLRSASSVRWFVSQDVILPKGPT